MSNIVRDSTGAPKAGAPSKGYQTGMKKILEDHAEIQKLKERASTAIWYDHQSPGIRSRRKQAQQEFEFFVQEHLELAEPDQKVIWDISTFIEYTKLWLSVVATFIKGKIGGKPKAGVLFQRKEALYWWAIRKIPKFPEIYGMWHAECVGLITKTADLDGFETGNFQKNILSDTDLALFFSALKQYSRGRDNWKQNYMMWVMVYLIGVRVGSFTVGTGYEKGAPLGDGSAVRTSDETLRWSDVEFRRTQRGIIVRVTFRYFKGYRMRHDAKNSVESRKTWTFVPSRSSRYEFDLSLLLLGTAFSRGLFEASTIEELLSGDDEYIAVNDDVNREPIFLQSDKAEKLQRGVAMRAGTANDKLKQICKDHGYFGRNTLYSLRRVALIELKRKHGTEYAGESATHKPQSTSIYSYDTVGQGDIDWTADRLDQVGMNRKVLRELYNQYNTGRVDVAPSGNRQTSRGEQLQIRVDAMVFDDERYIEGERSLFSQMQDIAAQFEEEASGKPSEIQVYKAKLLESGTEAHIDLHAKLVQMLKDRKNLKRKLRKQYETVARNEMLADHKKNMRFAKEGARPAMAAIPAMRVDSRAIVDGIDKEIESEINGLTVPGAGDSDEDIDMDDDDDNDASSDVDVEAIDEHGQENAEQIWADIPDEIELDVDRGDDGDPTATEAGRVAFLKGWVTLQSSQIANLSCIQCELDDTMPQNKKDARYNMTKLNRHLSTGVHSRWEQLLRAFHIDQGSNTKANCPLCHELFSQGTFKKHVEKEHPEQME